MGGQKETDDIHLLWVLSCSALAGAPLFLELYLFYQVANLPIGLFESVDKRGQLSRSHALHGRKSMQSTDEEAEQQIAVVVCIAEKF